MAVNRGTLINLQSTGVERKRVRPTTTEGVPGVTFFGGFIDQKEKNADLTGTRRYTTFDNIIANTSIVGAGVRFYLNMVGKAEWTVVAPEMDTATRQAEADDMALLVDEIINDMRRPWHRVVRRAAMYRFYGFSVQEWTAKRREDGVIGYLDIAPRPQATIEQWDIEVDGNILAAIQESPNASDSIYLNRDKIVYLVDDSLSDSPEGLGLLRHMVDANARLKLFELLESFSFETDLRGTPIAKGPFAALEDEVRAKNLTPEDRDKMIKPLRDFVQNHAKSPTRGLLLDSEPYRGEGEDQSPGSTPQWSFEIVQGGSQGQQAVAGSIERLNRELARIMGVEGLLLGSTGTGSLALSSDKSQNFALIVTSALKEIREQFEKDILGPLWRLNGWDEDLMPSFQTEQIQFRDVREITGALQELASAGAPIPPDWDGINVLLEQLGLPPVRMEDLALDASLLPGTSSTPALNAGNTNREPVDDGSDDATPNENVDDRGTE